jgi:hypothetical protein
MTEAWPETTGRVADGHVQGASLKPAAHWAPSRCYYGPAYGLFGNKRATMRISFGGRYSIDEFGDAIDRLLQNLRQNGVEEFLNVNLYLTPHDRKRVIELLDEQGQVIDHIKYDGPRERVFKRTGAGVRVMHPSKISFKPMKTGDDL